MTVLKHVAEGMTFAWKTPNPRAPAVDHGPPAYAFTLSSVTTADSGDYQAIAKIGDIAIGRSTVLNFQVADSAPPSLQEFPSSFAYSGHGFGDNVSVTIADASAHDNGRTYSIEASTEEYDNNKTGAFLSSSDSYWQPQNGRYQTAGGGYEGLGPLISDPARRGRTASGQAGPIHSRRLPQCCTGYSFVLRKLLVETVASNFSLAPNTLLVFGCRDTDGAYTLITSVARTTITWARTSTTARPILTCPIHDDERPRNIRIRRVRFFG